MDYRLGHNNYAVSVHGAFSGVNADVAGGGAANITGSTGDTVFTNWHLLSQFGLYGWYIGGITTTNRPTMTAEGPAAFIQRGSKSLTLTDCKADFGPTDESMVRVHNTQLFQTNGGTFNNTGGKKAVLRIHDGIKATVNGGTWIGDADFGPLGENEGGINMPPGPERDFHDAQRLQFLGIYNASFNSQFIKINPGIVYGEVKSTSFAATKGGALFSTPFPYMNRPASAVHFIDCPLSYKGTNNDPGRVFSGDDGSKNMHASGKTTFNGKPFSH